MTHYFRFLPAPVKKKNFLFSWLSNLSITSWIIIANILVYIFLAFVINSPDCSVSLCRYMALQPDNFFAGYFWTPLTSMFSHIMFLHLFVNMLSLFFIGKFLETLIGRKRFFWLYIFSGIFAGLFYVALAFIFGGSFMGSRLFGSAQTYAVGASGALFGVAGVLALLTPKNRVYLIAGPLLAVILDSILSNYFANNFFSSLISFILTAYIFISLLLILIPLSTSSKFSLPIQIPFWALPLVAIVPLFIASLFFELPIGNSAHLGGFIAGALYGYYLRIKYKKKTQAISNYFS
jgi:membrane associated rhomboid family serine protease